jgi:hypothetical protein
MLQFQHDGSAVTQGHKVRLHLQFCCGFLLLMYVNEWMSYECSDEGTCIQNIHNPSTRPQASEEENRTSQE